MLAVFIVTNSASCSPDCASVTGTQLANSQKPSHNKY